MKKTFFRVINLNGNEANRELNYAAMSLLFSVGEGQI